MSKATHSEAFRIFLIHELKLLSVEGNIDSKPEAFEKFAAAIENDPVFQSKFEELLSECIQDYGEQHGLKWYY